MKRLLLVCLALVALSCGNKYDNSDISKTYNDCGVVSPVVEISCKTKQTTPNGANVYSVGGVSQDVLGRIDLGLSLAIADARISGMTERTHHEFYDIYIPVRTCEPSPVNQTPSFVVWDNGAFNTSYDGTAFDYYNPEGKETDPARIASGYIWKRDGKAKVYIAEQVLNVGTPTSTTQRGAMVVCPEIALDGARFGAEHILLANNPDPTRPDDYYWYYYATEVHTLGGHPILPAPWR